MAVIDLRKKRHSFSLKLKNDILTEKKRLFSPGQKIQQDNINHSQMAYEQGQTFVMCQ
jgi:hypothetical protein